MVFSWVTLGSMRSHVNDCYNSMLTSHEDVEVGRCVTKSTGKVCTWAYDMQTHFYHSAGGKDDKGADTLTYEIVVQSNKDEKFFIIH